MRTSGSPRDELWPKLSVEPPVKYSIILDVQEFIRDVADLYDKAIQEENMDSHFHKEGDWPLLDRLQELGYPSLHAVLSKEPALLEGVVREWLDCEILDRLLPGAQNGVPQYLVNSVDQVAVENGHITIQGQAYIHPHFPAALDVSVSTINQSKTTNRL